MKKLSKTLALLLALTMVLCLAACGGSKDALSGTWSADLGDDGVITWTFDGKGKCTMENSYMKQKGTYTIDEDLSDTLSDGHSNHNNAEETRP